MIRVGIADAHGIESYLPAGDAKVGILSMRASLNRQRHALVYSIEVDEVQDEIINNFINKKDFMGALRYIKAFVKNISVQKGYQKSWKLIPNHDLDPWY